LHVVDAAFLLFQLAHQDVNEGGCGVHGKLLFICDNPCRCGDSQGVCLSLE
jgi:hypothetical protein